jgi:hypothetical protein
MSEKLDQILDEIKDIKFTINRIENKLDSTHEQVVRNSEAIKRMK